MRYLFIILLFISYNSFGQAFWTGKGSDSVKTTYNTILNGALRMALYATSDTNDVLGWDNKGNVVVRKKGGGSSGADTSIPHTWTAAQTFTTVKYKGSVLGTITEVAPAVVPFSFTMTKPSVQGANHSTLHNDGSGGESWNLVNLTTDVMGYLPAANGGLDTSGNHTWTGSNTFTNTAGTNFDIDNIGTDDKVSVALRNNTPADDGAPNQNSPNIEFKASGSDGAGGSPNTYLMHEYLESQYADRSRLVWEFSRDGGATFLPPAMWLYDFGGVRFAGPTFELDNGDVYVDRGDIRLGGLGSHTGAVQLNGGTSGTTTITIPDIAGSYTWVAPPSIAASTGMALVVTGINSNTVTTAFSAINAVTSISAGTGLSGGTITSTGTISLPNAGTSGTYGAATSVPIITTDAQGRVTTVTTVTPTVSTISYAGLNLRPVLTLSANGTPSSDLTGTNSETNLGTVFIPGGIVGAGVTIEIAAQWNFTGIAGSKTCLIKLSSSSGTTGTTMSFASAFAAANLSSQHILFINASSASAESSYSGTAFNSANNNLATASVDCSGGCYLNFTGALGNTNDHMKLQSYTVKIAAQ